MKYSASEKYIFETGHKRQVESVLWRFYFI